MAVIASPVDFWGVNYYTVNAVRAVDGDIPLEVVPPAGVPVTAFGWAICLRDSKPVAFVPLAAGIVLLLCCVVYGESSLRRWRALADADVVHIHGGIWRSQIAYGVLRRILRDTVFVVHLHGTDARTGRGLHHMNWANVVLVSTPDLARLVDVILGDEMKAAHLVRHG